MCLMRILDSKEKSNRSHAHAVTKCHGASVYGASRMIRSEPLQHVLGTKTRRSRVAHPNLPRRTAVGPYDNLLTLSPPEFGGEKLQWRIRPTHAARQGTKGHRAPDPLEETASSTISLLELKLADPQPLSPLNRTTRRAIALPPQWTGRSLFPSSRPLRPRSQ